MKQIGEQGYQPSGFSNKKGTRILRSRQSECYQPAAGLQNDFNPK
jgi:hypothetical protein